EKELQHCLSRVLPSFGQTKYVTCAFISESYANLGTFSYLAHKIAFACSWPAYLGDKVTDHEWKMIQDNCNYWRNYGDISDSWGSVRSIIEYYRKHAETFAKYHGE